MAAPLVLLKAVNYSGSGTWSDESGNARNATKENGTIAKNAAGNGIVLDGSTSWTFPNAEVGNAWTVNVWYKNTGTSTGSSPASILTQIDSTSNGTFNVILYNDTGRSFAFYNDATWRTGTAMTFQDNVWTNIQGTWNGTNLSTYINGTLIGTTQPGGTSLDSGDLYRIGRRWDDASYMVGEIGEVRIYDYARNQTQVSADYNTSLPTFIKLVVLLKAVNYSGSGTWSDESGNGKNATKEYGTIAKNAAGNGIVLNGSTSWTFPNLALGSNWSVNVWYKQTGPIPAAGTNPCLVTQILANDLVNMALSYTDNSSVCNTTLRSGGYYNDDAWYQTTGPIYLYLGGTYPARSDAGIPTGVWGNIQVVWNGTTMAIYTNGTFAYNNSAQTITGPGSVDSGAAYVIGRNWTNLEYMIGEIGEVRIYNAAISSTQVYADYYESLPTFRNQLLLLKAVDFKQTPVTDPTTIPGCQLWLDSSDQTTLTLSGSTVTEWRDKSGQANNTTTVTGTPTYSAGQGIVFNGSSYFIGNFNTPITQTTVTAFAVATLSAGNTASNRLLSVGTTGTPDYTNSESSPIIFGNEQIMYTGRYGAQYNSGVSIAAYDTAFLLSVNQYPAYQSMSLNGNTPVSINGSSSAFNLVNYAVGGELGGDPSIYNGTIKEILVYNTGFTDPQRRLVEGYLAWKWGLESQLPSSHPYRYTRPSIWQDESGRGNDAILAAGSIAKNSDNNGVVLNGTAIWAVPNIYAITDWTVSVWYKLTNSSSVGNLFGAEARQVDASFQVYSNGSTVDLRGLNQQAYGYYSTPVNVTLGQWINLQYTHYTTTGIVATYVNGQLVTNDSGLTGGEGFIPYFIGASGVIGEVGEISVYGYPFNQNQITAQYNSSYYVFNKSLRVLLRASNYSGTGDWQDETANGFDAVLNGTATKNVVGNGIILDGSTYWSFSNVGISSIWTVGVWYKVGDPSIAAAIVTQAYDGSNGNGPTVNYSSSTVNGSFKTGGTTYSGTSVGILPGQWINIQITWNGTRMRTYINGVLSGTNVISGYSQDYATDYYIGKGPVSGLIRGEIGEVRIYSYALTQAEVTADYNASLPTFRKLMVLLKAVDYTTGAWADGTGNGFNATIETGAATKNGAGNGLVLNGATNWTFSNVGVGNAWTASVWYKDTGTVNTNAPCILTQIFTFQINLINCMIGYAYVQGGAGPHVLSGGSYNGVLWRLGNAITLTANAWTNIQVTWDGTNMSTYVNGTLLGTTQPGGISTDSTSGYRIGRNWIDTDYMIGEIGEVRIYNYPLNQTQVTADYISSYYTFITSPTIPTVPFIDIRPKVSTNAITFDWEPPLLYGGQEYHYELSSPQDTRPSGGYYTIPSTTLRYTLAGLTDGTRYTFSIKAVNTVGAGPAATFRSVYVGPRAPSLKTAVAIPSSSNSAIININDSRPYFKQLTSSGSRGWVKIASSADGTILAATVGGANPGYIYISYDSGATWIEQTGSGSRNWSAIAMSSDGSKLVAGVSDGGVWKSSDSGFTWTALSGVGNSTNAEMAASSDGTVFYRVAYGGNLLRIYYSGSTWIYNYVGIGAGSDVTSVACDATGNTVYVTIYGSGIWKSIDSGATFVSILNNTSGWKGIRSSSTGQYLVAIAGPLNGNSGYIWTSSNSGVSWSHEPQIMNDIAGLAVSSDGSIMAAAESGGSIWISNDHGETFVEQAATNGKAWYSLALSSDGYKMVAAANGDYIYSLNVLYSYQIGWTAARTKILFGSGISYKNGDIFGHNTFKINDDFLPNNLDLINNMYTFNMSYINDSGYSVPVGTNPIGNVQYTVTNPSKTYYNKGFISVASSTDGQKMVACVLNEYIYTTTDGGVNWIQRVVGGTTRAWQAVASSADGTKFIAADGGGYMWTSANYGATWSQQTGSGARGWGPALAISANGQYIAAGNAYGYIYISADGGVTWTERTGSGALYWYGMAISNDGMTIYAGDYGSGAGGYIWKSTDSGVTWVSLSSYGGQWTCIRISSDTTKIIACGIFGYIYLSTNSGSTFNQLTTAGSRNWTSIAVSADFTKITATAQSVNIYYSKNSGATWTSGLYLPGGVDWRSITGDSTGKYLTVVAYNNVIWFSRNYGANWYYYLNPGIQAWSAPGLSISPDGSVLIAGTYQNGLYISNNGGLDWRVVLIYPNNGNNVNITSAFISADNSFIATCVNWTDTPTRIRTSPDSGYTWVEQTGSPSSQWADIAGSANGVKLFAVQLSGYPCVSYDQGLTWTEITTYSGGSLSTSWTGVACDSTGTRVAAISNSPGYIWLSSDSGITWTPQAWSFNYGWNDITSDSTGRYLAASSGSHIWTSADYGATWAQRLAAQQDVPFRSISSSAYGNNLIAVVSNPYNSLAGFWWMSSDFGVTWNKQLSITGGFWGSVASSANARRIIAGYGLGNGSQLFIGNIN